MAKTDGNLLRPTRLPHGVGVAIFRPRTQRDALSVFDGSRLHHTKKHRHKNGGARVVEPTGIEPVSKNPLIQPSP